MRIRAVILLTTLAAPILAVAANADPGLNSEDVTTKVAGKVTELRVDGDISHVRVTPGKASSVTAHLEWTLAKPTVTVSVSKGVVSVKARCNDDISGGPVHIGVIITCVDDLNIVVPDASSLVIGTGSGVDVTRMTGAMDLRGDRVTVMDVRTQRLKISSRSSATVRRVRASFAQLSGSSGNVYIDHLQGRSLSVTSGSGSVNANDITAGSFHVSDSSGNVYLARVKANSVDLSSGNGTVSATDLRTLQTTLATSSGNVYGERITTSRLDVSSGNGTVSVIDCAAQRSLVTARSGNVNVQRLRGDRLESSTGNGTLTIGDVHVRTINAQSSSGNVTVQDLDAPATLRANSGNGSVNVRVPSGRYYVEARSNNGSVHVSGLTADRFAKREITALSSSGNVSVTGV